MKRDLKYTNYWSSLLIQLCTLYIFLFGFSLKISIFNITDSAFHVTISNCCLIRNVFFSNYMSFYIIILDNFYFMSLFRPIPFLTCLPVVVHLVEVYRILCTLTSETSSRFVFLWTSWFLTLKILNYFWYKISRFLGSLEVRLLYFLSLIFHDTWLTFNLVS